VLDVTLNHGGIGLSKIRAERHWVRDGATAASGVRIFRVHDAQFSAAARTQPKQRAIVDSAKVASTCGVESV
jgi:hypothetical protein